MWWTQFHTWRTTWAAWILPVHGHSCSSLLPFREGRWVFCCQWSVAGSSCLCHVLHLSQVAVAVSSREPEGAELHAASFLSSASPAGSASLGPTLHLQTACRQHEWKVFSWAASAVSSLPFVCVCVCGGVSLLHSDLYSLVDVFSCPIATEHLDHLTLSEHVFSASHTFTTACARIINKQRLCLVESQNSSEYNISVRPLFHIHIQQPEATSINDESTQHLHNVSLRKSKIFAGRLNDKHICRWNYGPKLQSGWRIMLLSYLLSLFFSFSLLGANLTPSRCMRIHRKPPHMHIQPSEEFRY